MKKSFAGQTIILAASLLLQLNTLCFHSHGAAGDVDLSFDPGSGVNGSVTAVVLQPDGKVVLGGGGFTMVKGLLRTNLARLNADGSGDATFDAGPTMSGLTGGPVTALALQPDGKLLVAGAFAAAFCDETGCIQDYNATVLRLNADGSRDQTFAAALADYSSVPREFRSLVSLPDGKILVGGEFLNINGTIRVNVARLNANGTVDTNFNTTGLSGAVQQVVALPDGHVLIAGNFNLLEGTNRFGVARLNANGSLDPTFDAGFVSYRSLDCGPQFTCWEYTDITALTLQPNGKLLVGVWKRLYQSPLGGGEIITDQYSVKRLNANGSNDPGFVFTNSAQTKRVRSLMVQPDARVLMQHGEFNTSRIHRLNANGSWDDSFQPANTSGDVNAAALQPDGKVIIGGTSVSVDANNGRRLSRLNADGSRDMTFDAGQGLESPVSKLALLPDGKVLIGGQLVVGDPWWGPLGDTRAFVNGTNRHGRARLNVNGSPDNGFIPTPFHPPLGARFPTGDCPGDPRYGCLYGFVSTALTVQSNGKVLIGGYFVSTIYGDETFVQNYHPFLGRFTANGGLESEFNLPDPYVTAMAEQPDGKIVLGGSLTLNGTNSAVARLHSDGSVDGSFQLGQGPASASCLALQSDGKLVVGGANSIVRLNSNGSRDLGFGPVVLSNGGAHSLALQPDGKVLVGGSFTAVNGTNRHRIARLHSNGTLDNSFNPGTGPDGGVGSIALQPDGKVLIAGNFNTVSGVVRPYVARLYGDSPFPSLTLASSGGSTILSWPATALNIQLQESTDLSLPNAWLPVAQAAVNNTGQFSVNVPITGGNKFFRLKAQ